MATIIQEKPSPAPVREKTGWRNVGGPERWARLIIGVFLLFLGLGPDTTGAAGIGLKVAGAILILTALVRFCPVNALFGRNSCVTRRGP